MAKQAIFLSAGHGGSDPGAVSGKYVERDLTIELRDLIAPHLVAKGLTVVRDQNSWALKDTLIQFGAFWKKSLFSNRSWFIDIHFNAATPQAKGVECFVAAGASKEEITMAQQASYALATLLRTPVRSGSKGLPNGVKYETDDRHKRLGFLHNPGKCMLVEVCFLTNEQEMNTYEANKTIIARSLAQIIAENSGLLS
jgi:N-acetylmuramoyl-L-alanine amidase